MSAEVSSEKSNKLLAEIFSGESKRCFGLLRLAPECFIFICYFVVFEWIKRASPLPPDSYGETFVLWEFCSFLLSRPKLGILLLPLLCFLIWKRRVLWIKWNSIPEHWVLQIIIGTTVISLAWPLVACPYNFFTDQLHLADRILLLALAVASMWRPLFLLPLTLCAAPLVWEFRTGWGPYPWEFFGMPLRLIVLFFVWFCFSSLRQTWKHSSFLFLMLCLIAAHYWGPGLTKIQTGWFWENKISYLLSGSHAIGWLAFASPESIAKATSILSKLNFLLIFGAIVVEIGCLCILLARARGAIIYLLLAAGFHFGIFFICGIFLWQWAIIEFVAAITLWRKKHLLSREMFSFWHLALSVVLVASAPIWLKSAKLTWFDGPVKYSYRFSAIDDQGNTWELPPQFFAPYDKQFSLNVLNYLSQGEPLLTTGPRKAISSQEEARTLEDLEALELSEGIPVSNERALEHMKHFLETVATNYNRHPERRTWFKFISPPPGIVTSARGDRLEKQHTIRQVAADEVLTFFDGKDYREMRIRRVLEIEIPSP